jgi:hypothetical protein
MTCLLILLHLLSPYLLAQATIYLLGAQGHLWQTLGINPVFSIHGELGLVTTASLWLFPLAMVIFMGVARLPDAYRSELTGFHLGWWPWIRLYVLPSYGSAFCLSFGICGLMAFWNYDLASMLRVNVFPVEVLAAFGSFYDFSQAVELTLVPACVSALLAVALLVLATRETWGSEVRDNRIEPEAGGPWGSGMVLFVLLLLYSLIAWGLAGTVASPQGFFESISDFRSEWWNTVRYGISAGLGVGVWVALTVVLGLVCKGWVWRVGLALCLVPWLLPPTVLAMGWTSLWPLPVFSSVRGAGAELYLVEMHSALMVVPALGMLFSLVWRSKLDETLDTLDTPLHIRGLLLSQSLNGRMGILCFIGFALAIREVPAGLLNMPPGGGTLALSIETLLHFEQPERVAALCIAYFITALGGMLAFAAMGSVVDGLARRRLRKDLVS